MRIETIYTLKQPLSHIGGSEGTTSFLNTVRIANNGKVEEVFALTGNAIRGTLRDCAARHLLDLLEIRLKKKEFHILFSGGNISGDMAANVDQARRYRNLLPMISIFGAGVGNQILAGKITMGFAYPVCAETREIIPDSDGIKKELFEKSWKSQTGTVSFTRMDDAKNANYEKYLKNKEEDTDKNAAATQMRYEVEYLAPGAQLYHVTNLCAEQFLEIGAYAAALKEFSKSPVLGGMGGKGFGMCDAQIEANTVGSMSIKNGSFLASSFFQATIEAYEIFIFSHRDEIVDFLGGEKDGA